MPQDIGEIAMDLLGANCLILYECGIFHRQSAKIHDRGAHLVMESVFKSDFYVLICGSTLSTGLQMEQAQGANLSVLLIIMTLLLWRNYKQYKSWKFDEKSMNIYF